VYGRQRLTIVAGMPTTHALIATALTPARGPFHSIRLRDRRPALVSAS
jgi:hypothetical protein